MPDVTVHRENDSLGVSVVDCHTRLVSIDETYDRIYQEMKAKRLRSARRSAATSKSTWSA